MVQELKRSGITDEAVLQAMGTVPRHLFVEEALRVQAYEDIRLPIGYGQTILERLQSGAEAGPIPGNRPYKKAGGRGMAPQTGDTCSQCGLCAARCPAGAIDKNDAKTVDPTKCISCMRCVAICPQHAKFLDAAKLAGISAMLEKVCAERKKCELY